MDSISFLINVESPQIRLAEVASGRLRDLDIERESNSLGDIYLANVENVLSGMDAAFVDIGHTRNALLYAGDVENADHTGNLPGATISQLLNVGQSVIVQVARAPIGNKGARVSARLSLPGRYVLLMTGSENIGVSRKIESSQERERLRKIVEKFRPLGHGVIVRTEAEGVSDTELANDLSFLWARLQHIKSKAAAASTGFVSAPSLLHREVGLLGRLVRDRLNQQVESVVVDAPNEYQTLRELAQIVAPQFIERIHLYSGSTPLFDHYGIEADVKLAMERVVPLAQGGYLVIDEAEALTAIDVNTGKFVGKSRLADTVLKTNLEAAEEAARQLRLRNIGGVIVIDFIDMERTRDRIQVMNALEQALKSDRARTRIVQLSPLGLVEMTRRREGDSLRRALHQPCPCCQGDGVIQTPTTTALEARRLVRRLAAERLSARATQAVQAPQAVAGSAAAIQISLHPEAAMAMLGENGELMPALETVSGMHVVVRADFSLRQGVIHSAVGDAALFVSDSDEFQRGARLQLSAQSLPHVEEPPFAVVRGTLVLLQNPADEPSSAACSGRRPAIIEITDTTTKRWFVSARVLTWNEEAKSEEAKPQPGN